MDPNQDPNFIPPTYSHDPGEEKNTVIAFLSYIFFIFPIFTDAKDDPFVLFHAKQSFVLFVLILLVRLFYIVMGWYIPFILLSTAIFILWCMGVLSVFIGKQTPLPFVGALARHIRL